MNGPRRPPRGLLVAFMGCQRATLCPGDPPFTFGRGSDRTLQFGHDTVSGGPDLDISRNAGSIYYDQGLWVLRNDSASRPFDVIVRGVSNPLPKHTRWAIGPPDLEIRISGEAGRYLLGVSADDPRPVPVENPKSGDDGTRPLPEPTDRDRLLLTAKFLALPDPGDAVGNKEAAEYASAARPHEEPVTAKAVEDCVGRWCRRLLERGVIGIGGRDNINQLGRQLLAWGYLRQEDRKLLRGG